MCRCPACSHSLTHSLPLRKCASHCAISLQWCGKHKSTPPLWISSCSPKREYVIALHSMCLRINATALGATTPPCLSRNQDAPARSARSPLGLPADLSRFRRFPQREVSRAFFLAVLGERES
eukprot:scaffold1239_cov175-Pinguiococcus_pyrenoidosus.AAC.40